METAQTPQTPRPAGPAAADGQTAADGQEMMQAIVQSRYGTVPEDVMRLDQVARPGIGDDEVLIQVRAAAADRGTWHVMAGQPYLMRLLARGTRARA